MYSTIEVYLKYRQRTGERLKPSSPIFREACNHESLLSANSPKALTILAVHSILKHNAIDAGLQTVERSEDTKTSTNKCRKGVIAFYQYQMYMS